MAVPQVEAVKQSDTKDEGLYSESGDAVVKVGMGSEPIEGLNR